MEHPPHKIRVLHFVYSLTGGGAERQLVNFLNKADDANFENAVCCVDAQGRSLLQNPVCIYEIPRASQYDPRWRPILKLVSEWKPDIIHNWMPAVMLSSLPARLSGVRHYLGSFRGTYQLNDIRRYIHALGFFFIDKAVSNLYPEDMLFPFKQLFRMKSGEVIPNGMDVQAIEEARPAALEPWGIDPTLPKILYTGRLIPSKNVEILIEALTLLEKEHACSSQLIICGTGAESARLERLASDAGLMHRVFFTGYRQDVYQFMKSCDIFVMPSLTEGMPNVLFEAMIAKLPVVASDIAVHRRWIEPGVNGLLFDPHDPKKLGQVLFEMLQHRDGLTPWLVRNAHHMASGLSIEKMTRRYEDLYQRMLAG
jgi:glycosyltransferase involved in cell wall biosynthesis